MMSLSRRKYVMFSRFPCVKISRGRGGKLLNPGSIRSGRNNGETRTWSGRLWSTVRAAVVENYL